MENHVSGFEYLFLNIPNLVRSMGLRGSMPENTVLNDQLIILIKSY